MDGFQATMEIRKLVNHKDTVIIALTAASLSDVKEQMEQSKL
jgi:CheY-like chemotaxis protein